MAAMVNMSNLLSGKDSRWLQLEVCREFQRNKCSRQDTECKFAHPPANVEVQNGKVTACYDSIKGRCNRDKPPCKYFHPPQHLKDQLLINGRNHLALKNALMQQMGIASGQPVLAGQVPTVAANPYLTGIPANTYSPYFAPGHLVPALLGPDPAAVASQLGPVVPQAVQVTQQKLPRSDRLEAYSGMVPIKRPAAEKYGNPVYPGATTYQQLMQLQQPFVPISCEYQSENSTSSTTTTTAPTTTTTTINCTTTTTFAATAVVSAATTATTTSLSANITQQQYNHYQQQLQQHYNHQQQPLLPPQPPIQQQFILQPSSQSFTLNTPSQTVNTTTNNTSHQVINNLLTNNNNNNNFNKYHYSSSTHTNGNCNLTLSTYNSGNNTKNTNNSKANNSFFLLYNNNNSSNNNNNNSNSNSNNNNNNNSNNNINNNNNSNCLNYVNNNLNSDNKLIVTSPTTKATTINTLAANTSSAKTTTDLTTAAPDTASNSNNNSNSSINRDMTVTDPLSINSITTTVANNNNPAINATTTTTPNHTETPEQTESNTNEIVPVLPVVSTFSSIVTTSEKGITTVTPAANSIAANNATVISSKTIIKSNDDEISRNTKHQYLTNKSEISNLNGGSDLHDVVNGCSDSNQTTLSTGILPTPTSSSTITNAYQAHQNMQRLYQSYNTAVVAASYASVRGHYTPACSTGAYNNIQSITVPSYANATTHGVYGYSTPNTASYYVDEAANITKEIAQKNYVNAMKAASASTATTYTGKPLTAYAGIALNKAYVAAATPAATGSAMAHQAAALVQAQQAQAAAAVAAATQLRQLSSLPNSGLSTPVGTPVHTPVSTPALLQRAAPIPTGGYFHAASPATLMRAQPLALAAPAATTQYTTMPQQQQQSHQTAYFFPGFLPTAGAYQFAAMGSMPAHVTASAITSGIAAAQLGQLPNTASTQGTMVLNPYKKMKTS